MMYRFYSADIQADIDRYQAAYDRDMIEQEREKMEHPEMIPLWQDAWLQRQVALAHMDELHLYLELYDPTEYRGYPIESEEDMLEYCLQDNCTFADFCIERGWADAENPV